MEFKLLKKLNIETVEIEGKHYVEAEAMEKQVVGVLGAIQLVEGLMLLGDATKEEMSAFKNKVSEFTKEFGNGN